MLPNEIPNEQQRLTIENNKLIIELEAIKNKVKILETDLRVKYDDFDWSVIWQDEEKSNIMQMIPIVSIVLEIIVIVIILFK